MENEGSEVAGEVTEAPRVSDAYSLARTIIERMLQEGLTGVIEDSIGFADDEDREEMIDGFTSTIERVISERWSPEAIALADNFMAEAKASSLVQPETEEKVG